MSYLVQDLWPLRYGIQSDSFQFAGGLEPLDYGVELHCGCHRGAKEGHVSPEPKTRLRLATCPLVRLLIWKH